MIPQICFSDISGNELEISENKFEISEKEIKVSVICIIIHVKLAFYTLDV